MPRLGGKKVICPVAKYVDFLQGVIMIFCKELWWLVQLSDGDSAGQQLLMSRFPRQCPAMGSSQQHFSRSYNDWSTQATMSIWQSIDEVFSLQCLLVCPQPSIQAVTDCSAKWPPSWSEKYLGGIFASLRLTPSPSLFIVVLLNRSTTSLTFNWGQKTWKITSVMVLPLWHKKKFLNFTSSPNTSPSWLPSASG